MREIGGGDGRHAGGAAGADPAHNDAVHDGLLDEPAHTPDREGVHYTAIMSRRKPVESAAR